MYNVNVGIFFVIVEGNACIPWKTFSFIYYFCCLFWVIPSFTNNTWVKIFLPGITLNWSTVSPF